MISAEEAQLHLVRWFWVFFFVSGLLAFVLPEQTIIGVVVEVLSTIVWSGFIFFWLTFDSKILGAPASSMFKLGAVLLAIVFVPIYMVRSRGYALGAWDLGVFLAKLIGGLLILVALAYALDMFGLLPGQT